MITLFSVAALFLPGRWKGGANLEDFLEYQ